MDIKSRKFISAAVAIIISVVGLITAILALVALIGKGGSNADKVMRYSLGGVALIVGLASLVVGLSKENVEPNTSDFIGSAFCIALGIALFLKIGEDIMSLLINAFVPLALACLGGVFFFKSIVAISKKEETGKCVIMLLLSVAALVGGILLYVFKSQKTLINVEWLLIGIGILIFGIAYLLSVINNKQFKLLRKKQ